MQDTGTDSEFHLTVTGIRRDGRRRYDADSKQTLTTAWEEAWRIALVVTG